MRATEFVILSVLCNNEHDPVIFLKEVLDTASGSVVW